MKIKNILQNVIMIAFVTIFLSGCTTTSDDIVVIDNATTRDANSVSSDDNKYKVYLITMDLADDFWKSIDNGCSQAVEELGGITYKWIGPDTHEDVLQKVCIEQAIDEEVDAILIAASSLTGINDTLEKVKKANIKIVYVDNAAEFDCVAFLATDNELAGKIAAETMKKALAESGITSGTIGISVNKANVISTSLRVKGFREIFKDTDFKLDDTFFMDDDPQSLKKFAENHPEYVAFFGSNERTTLALGEQMRDSGSKQIIIGFDTSDAVLALLNKGVVYAILQQNPKIMGYSGMKIAIEALKGSYTETNVKIDTGVNVLYKDTI